MGERTPGNLDPSDIGGVVAGVHRDDSHRFSKSTQPSIRLLEGRGVEGDAHCGTTVRHRSRVRKNPDRPNLRQVHLIASEFLEELATTGHPLRPGDLGENITTTGIDLLSLPADTEIRCGSQARVRITGLRNPCRQIDDFRPGLRKRVTGRGTGGEPVFAGGVMAVVVTTGTVCAGDLLTVVPPDGPERPLERA